MSVLKTHRSTWSGVAYWFTVMMFHPVIPRPGTRTPAARQLLVDDDLLDRTGAASQGGGQWGTMSPDSTRAWRTARAVVFGESPRRAPMRSASARISPRIASASGGRSRLTSRVVPRAASAVTSSASAGDPRSAWSERARRKKRWASCSQVNPMPPCTWMFICAFSTAGANAR